MGHDGGIEAEGELILIVTLEKPVPAHIRWFVDKGEHVGEHFPADLINLLVITSAIFFIALAYTIDNTSWSHKFNAISEKVYGLFPQGGEWRIIASYLGVLFIINSITGVFLASGLVLPSDGLVIFGGITQMVIGLVLVSQISFSVTAAMSTVLLSSMVYFGPAELIGHLPIFGIALLLFIQGSGSYRLSSRNPTSSNGIAKPEAARKQLSGSCLTPGGTQNCYPSCP